MAAMELGLAHSLGRYKLKFSPDKIDTMIVQVGSSCPASRMLNAILMMKISPEGID